MANAFGKEAYNKGFAESERYNGHYSKIEYYEIWKYAVTLLPEKCAILDIGCGPGQLAHMLYDIGYADYVGIDFSEVAIAIAKNNVPSFEFISADLRQVSFKKYGGRTIMCMEVFEHIKDDVALIRRLPKSEIIFSVPNYLSDNHYRTYGSVKYIRSYYNKLIKIHSVKKFKVSDENAIFVVHGNIK